MPAADRAVTAPTRAPALGERPGPPHTVAGLHRRKPAAGVVTGHVVERDEPEHLHRPAAVQALQQAR
ncbi:MAG: hypothetical protein M3450_08610 [Actinomycetota bacterium]|nr:hypothetical protein [Actinomycetota bacterium]